ncbi:MAG: phosphate acetyltransferase [Campylobacterota bacterium]|nr:phosphate acetyltransferase [Campylobacterota bacterium]
MKIKSLYIAAKDKNVGSLFISMSMMEVLKRNFYRVAFFKPILTSKDCEDYNISFMRKRYNLDMAYEECYGFTLEYVESMIAANKENELLNELIAKYKKLENEYDFVLCEGVRKSFLNANISYDLNQKIAQNFGSGYINIISAKNSSLEEIVENMQMEKKNIVCEGCDHFATFINRVDVAIYDDLLHMLKKESDVYALKEIPELDMLSIEDIIESTGANVITTKENYRTRVVKGFLVADSLVDNFLDNVKDGDLVVVSADRSDIVLALLGTLYSSSYPKISGILFTSGSKLHPNIAKLIEGIEIFHLALLSVETSSYDSINFLSKIYPRLRVDSHRKISLSLGLFNNSVDISRIEQRLQAPASEVLTPMMFEYKLFEMARRNKRRVVLPESMDERVLRAAEIILRRGVADIIFLAKEEEFVQRYSKLGLNLSDATIVDHLSSPLMQEFVEVFYEMRKEKGLTRQASKDAMIHVNYFATMMVHLGYADAMVSGAMHSTADTIRPALQIIKTKPSVSLVSSLFFMCFKTKVLVYGDCAINQDPSAEELAQIAISCAESASYFGIEPRVALLSYSSGESGEGEDVEKVKKAFEIVKLKNPNLLVEGPIQYDAAINKDVAKIKLPTSKIAGDATVFVFPDLNTGNNTYKAVQRSSDVIAIGPILQGLRKPVNDLSRGALVEDIVNTIAITAIQAGDMH